MYATGQVLLKYAAVSLAYCRVRLIIYHLLIESEVTTAGHLIGCGIKWKIMWKFLANGEKMPDYAEISKFKLIKMSPWLFPTYKIYVNVLLRILVLYDMFDILLPFMDRYFFFQHSFP